MYIFYCIFTRPKEKREREKFFCMNLSQAGIFYWLFWVCFLRLNLIEQIMQAAKRKSSSKEASKTQMLPWVNPLEWTEKFTLFSDSTLYLLVFIRLSTGLIIGSALIPCGIRFPLCLKIKICARGNYVDSFKSWIAAAELNWWREASWVSFFKLLYLFLCSMASKGILGITLLNSYLIGQPLPKSIGLLWKLFCLCLLLAPCFEVLGMV